MSDVPSVVAKQWIKGYIDEGHLGRIYHAKASWVRRRGIPGIGSWFASKELAGGGPLIRAS